MGAAGYPEIKPDDLTPYKSLVSLQKCSVGAYGTDTGGKV
jgi:hypothetical protein